MKYSLLILGVVFLWGCQDSQSDITPLTNFWDKAVPLQKIPKGLQSLKAVDCGQCHQAHYQEWKNSTHSRAWTDVQFQAEIKKESSPRMCINCHIPLENQQEDLVLGYHNDDVFHPVTKPNTQFDRSLQNEGITCAACHVRNNTIIGPNGNQNAPHAVVKDTKHLSEQLCINCHNAVSIIAPTLVCSFETGDEWKAGPYPQQNKNCKSCHMPELHHPLAIGGVPKTSHFHGFPGSGIPKSPSHHPEMLQGLQFEPFAEKKYSRGDSAKFSIALTNSFAGHKIPTGDPERYILVKFITRVNGHQTDSASFRIGEQWEWYPVAKKISDNNLKPLEKRVFDYTTFLPSSGDVVIDIEVFKYRSTAENVKYNHLPANTPIQIKAFEDKIIPYFGD